MAAPFIIQVAFNGRSELAREERKNTAFNQNARVIVEVLREQARSYRYWSGINFWSCARR
ncbi:hypothetical protein CI807_19815 [Pseudomonas sp. NS1(2017)]|nr:hypothetical protein CI807_19815 [Pseudomonas sp. NS1(2017)]